MGLRNLEALMLRELREVAGRQSIRQSDITEWSTGHVKTEEGESLFFLPSLRIHCAVKTAALGKLAATASEKTKNIASAKISGEVTDLSMDWTDTGATVSYKYNGTLPPITIHCPLCRELVEVNTEHRCGDHVQSENLKRKGRR